MTSNSISILIMLEIVVKKFRPIKLINPRRAKIAPVTCNSLGLTGITHSTPNFPLTKSFNIKTDKTGNMKLNHILLLTPLVVLVGLSAFLLSEEGWCDVNNECENSFYWVGWFIGLWIVFYGIPATGYLIYRKVKQKKKQGSK